ncbi:MAG: aquaporin, partial [Candidatus Latescibacteria bacterium]|nr:aquaporin [Candidatus Latescibacterota bacterium]
KRAGASDASPTKKGPVGIATAFGLIVMTMIYAIGHISGAHFNPAVTLAFAATRHFPHRQIAPYIAAQCLGALLASGVHALSLHPVLARLQPDTALNFGVTHPIDDRWLTAFTWEALLTFFLMLVIMAVATDFRAVGQMAGLAIGGTVWFEAMFAGPLCGASMNPAHSLGPAALSGEWGHFSAYVLGPVLGALDGALFYEFIRCHPREDNEAKGCC